MRYRCFIVLSFSVFMLFGGCDKLAKSALKGSLSKVGATIVESSSDDEIRNMFEQADAACPRTIDVHTTLEHVKMVNDQHVEFHYKVNDQGMEMVTYFDKVSMKKSAVDHLKDNPMAVAIAERDLSVEHIYEDDIGTHLFSFTINKHTLAGDLNPIGETQSNPFNVQTVSAKEDESVNLDRFFYQEEESDHEEQQEHVVADPIPVLPRQASPDHGGGVQVNPFFK